ncbi:MAG: hypothetical protein MZU91_12840 [Desulfosudis oleivorans]|nr:hypothetical protein [Desulfosudis oleivorans]
MLERLKKLEGSGPDAAAASARHRPRGTAELRAGSPGERAARTPVRSASRRHRHRCRKAPCRAPACHRRPAASRACRRPRASSASCWGTSQRARVPSRPRTRQRPAPPFATRAATCPAAPSPGRCFSAAWTHPPAARRSAIPSRCCCASPTTRSCPTSFAPA